MDYNIYIDESGNTGNIEINENMCWNFNVQSHFALGAIYVKENSEKILKAEIQNILHKYDFELGDIKELKSKANYRFKKELLAELINNLSSYNSRFYFDIANKKYKVIMNMVEYCIYPYYFYYNFDKTIDIRQSKINVATDLYNRLKIEDIKTFIDLCQSMEDENEIIKQFLDFLSNLKYLFNNKKLNEHTKIRNNIEKVMEYVVKSKQKGLKFKNLLPVKDYNNKGTKESFLPNVDAYNNLVGQISKLQLTTFDNISIYHDVQKQFSNVLIEWSKELRNKGCKIKRLEFRDSKSDILIQVCDFFTGSILRIYKEIANKRYLNREEREMVTLLKPLLWNCNIVAANYEQQNFFNQCKIKFVKTPIPFNC